MTDRELLLKLGYVEHSRKRKGCMLLVYWRDPRTGEVRAQGQLVEQHRYIARLKRTADFVKVCGGKP